MYYRFVDDVMISSAELNATLFRRIRQVAARGAKLLSTTTGLFRVNHGVRVVSKYVACLRYRSTCLLSFFRRRDSQGCSSMSTGTDG